MNFYSHLGIKLFEDDRECGTHDACTNENGIRVKLISRCVVKGRHCIVCLVTLHSDFPFRIARIILRADVFEAEWSNRRHLGDVLAGFRPVTCRVDRVRLAPWGLSYLSPSFAASGWSA